MFAMLLPKGVQLVGRVEAGRIRQRNLLDDAAARLQFPDNLKLFTEPVFLDRRERQERLAVPKPVQSLRGQCAGRNIIHDPIPESDADELSLFRRCHECRRHGSVLQIVRNHLLTAKYHHHTMIRTIRQSAGESKMQFGQRVRAIRKSKDLTQRQLAHRLGVSFSYISKVENERLQFGDYPSEKFIHKLADELDADEDELLLLADKVPASIRKRIREKPEAFRAISSLDDKALDRLVSQIDRSAKKKIR